MRSHNQSEELSVFKFCFDESRSSSLERELTISRLLRDKLGKRADIAHILGGNLKEPPYFLESEYVEGGNLREWGETNGRFVGLSLRERIRLVIEIAVALDAAHSVGIIHRDLKPSNILMRRDSDGSWHPILADFGIGTVEDPSKLTGRNITVDDLTVLLPNSGSPTGTLKYQPPEAGSKGPATVKWDIYALGVVFYQVLICNFGQPMALGFEQRIESAVRDSFRSMPLNSEHASAKRKRHTEEYLAPDSTAELTIRFLIEDLSLCVQGEPAARLGSVALLIERLNNLKNRIAAAKAQLRAAHANSLAAPLYWFSCVPDRSHCCRRPRYDHLLRVGGRRDRAENRDR